MSQTPALLFVCLGNICRSPLAEAAFRKAAVDAGLDAQADSAGTAAYHIGKAPDPRSIERAAMHGIDIGHYQARQIETRDFSRFTHILALDRQNLADIRKITPPDTQARIGLLMDAVPGREGSDVDDPYYGDADGFGVTWDDVGAAAAALVESLRQPDG